MLALDVRLIAVAAFEVAIVLTEAAGLAFLEPADSFVEERAEDWLAHPCGRLSSNSFKDTFCGA